MSEETMTMKLVVDKSKQKVLFAEAGKGCVDLVFHFLSLPLATVVSLVTEESMLGSIGTLYASLQTLSTDIRVVNDNSCFNRLTDVQTRFMDFHFSDSDPTDPDYEPDDQELDMCEHSESESDDPDYIEPEIDTFPGGYVSGLGTASYMIMDDLCVEQMSTVSALALLKKFDVGDLGQLEERVVTLDTQLAVGLLKASLKSKTVLTDVFMDVGTGTD